VQKLVQDSNVALETYQQQVRTLEEYIARGDGRYVAQPPFPRFSGPGALIEREGWEGWSSFRWRGSRSNSTRQSRPRHCAAIAQSNFYEEKCQKAVRRRQKLTTIKARRTHRCYQPDPSSNYLGRRELASCECGAFCACLTTCAGCHGSARRTACGQRGVGERGEVSPSICCVERRRNDVHAQFQERR
jgi:hypothetical protein